MDKQTMEANELLQYSLFEKISNLEKAIQEKDLQLNNLNSKIDNLMFLDDVTAKIRQSGNDPALISLWNARHYPVKL